MKMCAQLSNFYNKGMTSRLLYRRLAVPIRKKTMRPVLIFFEHTSSTQTYTQMVTVHSITRMTTSELKLKFFTDDRGLQTKRGFFF